MELYHQTTSRCTFRGHSNLGRGESYVLTSTIRAIPSRRCIVPWLKRCWELFKAFICLISLWESTFTVISLVRQAYSSESYPCWTFCPTYMTNFVLNSQNLSENDQTMKYLNRYPYQEKDQLS